MNKKTEDEKLLSRLENIYDKLCCWWYYSERWAREAAILISDKITEIKYSILMKKKSLPIN